MVKQLLFVFLFCCVSVADAASEVSPLERILLEQEIVLANQKMALKVSLATRNLWQQQGLNLTIDLAADKAISLLSANLLMSGAAPWQDLSISPEAEQVLLDDVVHYRWQAILFAKQLGVQDLPPLRLRLEGAGGAQKTISLPILSVYVRSLPIYVPAEAWVGKAEAAPMVEKGESWVLVGDQQTKIWQWQVQGLWSQAVVLPNLSGQAIAGLQPWVKVQHEWREGQYWTIIQAQQPWMATEMGCWTIATQDIWLFDAQTGKVQHWRIAGDTGFAIAPWLWHLIQGVVLLMLFGLLIRIGRWLRCRLRQRHYRQGVMHAADTEQLLQWLRLHWKLTDDIPLAHQARGLPIEAELIALEGMLFSEQMLHGYDFNRLKSQLVTQNHVLPC